MPLASITQFPFGGGLTAANLNAPTNSLKALLDAYVDSGATFAAMTIPMLAATPGLKLTQNASVGLGAGPVFMQGFAGDGTTNRFYIDYAGNFVGNSVSASLFLGKLFSTSNTKSIEQIPGDRLNTYSTTAVPYGQDMAFGTAAAPMTALGSAVQLSATWNQVASLYPGSNAVTTEGTSTLRAYSKGIATNQNQNAAIFAGSSTDSTLADVVGVFSIAVVNAGSSRAAYGAYLQAQRQGSGGYAYAGEIRTQNEGGADAFYHPDTGSPGYLQTAGFWITSGSSNAFKNSAGVGLGAAGSPFIGGFVATAGSVSQEVFADYSSATTSHKIAGTHTYGIDTKDGTFVSGQAIRLGNSQYILSRNNANSADIRLMGLDSLDRMAFYNSTFSIDSSANIYANGHLTTFDGGATATVFGNRSTPVSVLAPAAVTAQTVPDFTVNIAAINAYSPTTGLPIVKAAQNTASMAGNVPGTGGQSVYILVSIDTNLTAVLTVGTAGVTPTRPGLPSNNKGLAYILLPNGATAVTQAMISEFRDLFVPYNPNASGGAPAGLTYVSIADETSSGLASSVRLVTALNGGSAMGDSLAQVKPLATDASLRDIVMADRSNRDLAQSLTYSGAVVTLNVPAGKQHTVRFNGRVRTITSNITVTISGGAGAKTIYADLNTAAASTFTLGFTAYGAGPSNANQVPIADGYWDGAAFHGDGATTLNYAQSQTVGPAQIQPAILSAALGSAFTCTQTSGLLTTLATNFAGVNFYASGGTQMYFNGVLMFNINTTGLAAARAYIQAMSGATIVGATPIGTPWIQDLTAANLYATGTIPIQLALPANARTFITFGTNTTPASGYQVNGAYLIGVVTGAAV